MALYVLATPALVLLGTGVAMALPSTPDAMNNSGGARVLRGASTPTPRRPTTTAAPSPASPSPRPSSSSPWPRRCCSAGSCGIVLVLGLAGTLARSRAVPATAGTLPTHTPSSSRLLVGVIVLVAGLTFFPAWRSDPSRRRCHDHASTSPMHGPPRRAGRAVASDAASAAPPGPLERLPGAFRKLDPRHLWRTPVMFVVWLGSVVTTIGAVVRPQRCSSISIAVWLWLTVLFGNLAEAVAEGRGKAQADTLRAARTDTQARRLTADGYRAQIVPSSQLRRGDRVCVSGRRGHPRRRRRRATAWPASTSRRSPASPPR